MYSHIWASLVAQTVKNPPARWEIWVQSLGWEDPWRREQLPTPVFWPGKFHGQRGLVGYNPWGLKEWDIPSDFTYNHIYIRIYIHTYRMSLHLSVHLLDYSTI